MAINPESVVLNFFLSIQEALFGIIPIIGIIYLLKVFITALNEDM